jgi:hypothetical protein
MKRLFSLALLCTACLAFAADPVFVPDPARTPGALNPDITAETFHQKICVEGASQYRPSASYTTGLKKLQLRDNGYRDRDPTEYEEDHLIPLSLGGHPRSPKNLWPQPWQGRWGAHEKDRLEVALYKAACRGEITLGEAQAAFTPDWTASFKRYEGLMRRFRFRARDGTHDASGRIE